MGGWWWENEERVDELKKWLREWSKQDFGLPRSVRVWWQWDLSSRHEAHSPVCASPQSGTGFNQPGGNDQPRADDGSGGSRGKGAKGPATDALRALGPNLKEREAGRLAGWHWLAAMILHCSTAHWVIQGFRPATTVPT